MNDIEVNPHITLDGHIECFSGRKWRETKEPVDEGERGKWKNWLKTEHSEKGDHGSQSHHFMQIDGEKVEPMTDSFS